MLRLIPYKPLVRRIKVLTLVLFASGVLLASSKQRKQGACGSSLQRNLINCWGHEMDEIRDDKVNVTISIIILIILMGLICHSCVDAIVRTVETEEEQRIFRADTERPKAFRKASPTPEQMEHYHGLLQIMEVQREVQPLR